MSDISGAILTGVEAMMSCGALLRCSENTLIGLPKAA